ncbi:GNAT family N-acetyltransferase [Dehalococcoidia bacterium]|nr:GNAT family N-acetyltransferase [Dehalococcoidia bacterium]
MIEYQKNAALKLDDIVRVFNSSTINRPTDDPARIKTMFDHANLIISAWDTNKLVGVCRALTDFSYCCYLSDLAVDIEYQHQGIGRTMIENIRENIGEKTSLILLSAPDAMEYYPKVGFEKIENGYKIQRKI